MDNIESLIWDTITRSAKTRFNFSDFEKKLNAPKENLVDCLLFTIIDEFSKGESKKNIVTKVLQKTLQKKVHWEEFDIIRFIDDSEQNFKAEIYAANVVHDMQKQNKDLKDILYTVNQMIK